MINFYPLFVPLAPLIAALFTAIPQHNAGSKNFRISWWILFFGFINSLFLLWQTSHNPEPINLVLVSLAWKILPVVQLSIDRLAVVMMLVISGFGTLLYRYSTRYLRQDSGQVRYQVLLTLAVSSLLFMVTSADLLLIFIFWQLLTWFLCLLSHNYAHLPTAQSSFRTFIILRFGDLTFLAGIVLAYKFYGTLQIEELFRQASLNQISFELYNTGLEISGVTLVALLIFVAAMSKSAQFPLHMWLPDSLYAPTPIHALLHAGIVNSGAFLLARLAPLYILSPITLHIVLIIGLVTAILGRSMMLVQNDIKKTLGYSTIGQMGFMITECGLGAFPLAIFHLIAHGLFKADIFLNCGKVIHEARLKPIAAPQAAFETKAKKNEWILAFFLSFLIPLGIVVAVHYLFGIPFSNHSGLVILLLFSWATASQAMFTLFRIRKTIFTKVSFLLGITMITTSYFFAAEKFTDFLFPNEKLVESYFKAAEPPYGLFLTLAVLLILYITTTWYFALCPLQSKEEYTWFKSLKHRLYLFFMNRLYMDAISLRLTNSFKKIGNKLECSQVILILGLVLFLSIALSQNMLLALGCLSIFLTFWGSLKALIKIHVYRLLFYSLIAQYSIFLWHIAQLGKITTNAIFFAWAITLTWSSLFFAWSRITSRYGNLNLNQIGGLFKTMPRFALCLSLLIMAAVGLPPFNFFFAYLEILFDSSINSYGLIIIIPTWFITCWYMFKLMQQLLFGPYRKDVYYEDLNLVEIIIFVAVITLLLIPSEISLKWLLEVRFWFQ